MNMEEEYLPNYKQEFLNKKREEQNIFNQKNQLPNEDGQEIKKLMEKKEMTLQDSIRIKGMQTNDMFKTQQYQRDDWKDFIYQSYYKSMHNENEFVLNPKLNPECDERRFNMRKTRICEYSNALHNNRVFINPKFTSC